ncbi:MAG TPA: short-chain dehydrogenase/reductase [Stellaceae bacterium]|jgi:NAD(P)-dependent dehydrogenase (short-subunit alcohol dehydrogenase family)
MDLNLTGKKALITGGSSGIGFATAKRFVEEGVSVCIAARPGERLIKAREALNAMGENLMTFAADLSQAEARAALVEHCGDIDILVNSAGAIPRSTIEEMDEQAWRQSWELKLFGSIDLTRAYYLRMKQKRSGTIINVIGSAGERPDYRFAAGSVANAALMALTKALGGVSPDFNVRVLGVNPGSVGTERTIRQLKRVAVQRFGDESRWVEIDKEMDKTRPFGRIQTPEQMAAVIVFLASDHAQYVTGTTVNVDGGALARSNSH